MSRVVENTESSLELLLDTITNTFGGVLFLAILLAILSQMRGELSNALSQEEVPQEEVIRLQSQLMDSRADLKSLQLARKEQESLIDAYIDKELMQRWEEVKVIKAKHDILAQNRLEKMDSLAEKQTTINTIVQTLKQLDNDLEKAREEVAAKRKSLQEEIISRTKVAELPKTRGTRKIEIALILRYGKLYFQHHHPSDPIIRSLNTDDFFVLGEDSSFVRVTPKPYRGIAVSLGQLEVLKQHIEKIKPSNCYFCVAVWDDSFDQFATIRSILVNMGFEYRTLPIPKGEFIVESYVENPQVQ